MAPIIKKRSADANEEELEEKKPKMEIKEEDRVVIVVDGSGDGGEPVDEDKKKIVGKDEGVDDDEAIMFDALKEIKRLLSKLNLSQRKLATASNVSRSSIQSWLSGDTELGRTNRETMLGWFVGTTLDELQKLRSRHHAPRVVVAALDGCIAKESVDDVRRRCQQALATTLPGPDHATISNKATKKLALRLHRRVGVDRV